MIKLNKKIVTCITAIIIITGIYLRVKYYLTNRSLWLDELFLYFSISDKDALNTLFIQKYYQLSPVVFFLVEKWACDLFGRGEYILRLFPLLCGIASIFLFYKLLRSCYSKLSLLMPLTMFCFCGHLIYYSSEAKQYSSDILITILLTIIGLNLQKEGLNKTNKLFLIFTPIIAIFGSLTSVFTLASITILFLINYFILDKKINVKENIIFSSLWISSFIIYTFLSIQNHLNNTYLHKFWKVGYTSDQNSVFKLFEDYFLYLGFEHYYYPFFITTFAVGLISMVARKKENGVYFISPLILLLATNSLGLYPASQRLVLFTLPIVYIVIADFIDYITSSKIMFMKIWGYLLTVLVFCITLNTSFKELSEPMKKEDVKQCLNYIYDNKLPDDIIFLQYFSQYSFKYYGKAYNFLDNFTPPEAWAHLSIRRNFFKNKRWYTSNNKNKVFISNISKYTCMNRRRIKYELDMLRGYPRVWILLSHDATFYSIKFKKYLDKAGRQVDFIRIPGREGADSHLYLYDFSSTKEVSHDKKKLFSKLKGFLHRFKHEK